MPLAVLHPALDQLLALRRVLGLRNPGHTLAKLLPAVRRCGWSTTPTRNTRSACPSSWS
jgi:hypothetical protein